MVLVFLGVTMYYFKIPFVSTIFVLSPSILPLVTAIWVVAMANAVNLIDGLDGLAAGIIAIAAGTLCIYGLRLEVLGNLSADNLGPVIAAITCGVCVGFLPHNFHPARVFMGDGGALFLGLLMAAATMVIGGRTSANGAAATDVTGLTFFRFAPFFIPFFILGVPILDVAFAIVRRTVRGTSFAERDLGHLHHRLVRLGHGHRRAVLILWAWTAVLSIFVLLVTFGLHYSAFVPFGALFLVAVLYTVFLPGARAARRNRRSSPRAPTPRRRVPARLGRRRSRSSCRGQPASPWRASRISPRPGPRRRRRVVRRALRPTAPTLRPAPTRELAHHLRILSARTTRWEDEPRVSRSPGPTYVELAGMGVTAGACVGIGVGVGYWIGAVSGAGAGVTFAGLAVGSFAAVAATYFKIKRYL